MFVQLAVMLGAGGGKINSVLPSGGPEGSDEGAVRPWVEIVLDKGEKMLGGRAGEKRTGHFQAQPEGWTTNGGGM